MISTTRGLISWQENGKWVGILSETDSYPTYLGEQLHYWATDLGMQRMIDLLGKYGTFEEFECEGICPLCGKNNVGVPVDIKARALHMLHSDPMHHPDSAGKYHRHKKVGRVTGFTKDVEWAYLLDVQNNEIMVYYCTTDDKNCSGNTIQCREGDARFYYIRAGAIGVGRYISYDDLLAIEKESDKEGK
jgi:hypothetical protein